MHENIFVLYWDMHDTKPNDSKININVEIRNKMLNFEELKIKEDNE